MAKKEKYEVHLYDWHGNCVEHVYTDTLAMAERVRSEHAEKMGLRPEAASDIPLYPTIWKCFSGGWSRLLGY